MDRTYPGTVTRWIDADHFTVQWTAECSSRFRLNGIRIPAANRSRAKVLAESLCPIGSTVGITPHPGNDFGELLADVSTLHGGDVADIVIDAELGFPFTPR